MTAEGTIGAPTCFRANAVRFCVRFPALSGLQLNFQLVFFWSVFTIGCDWCKKKNRNTQPVACKLCNRTRARTYRHGSCLTKENRLPSSCSSLVPPTTKSSGFVTHPMRSMLQMKGSFVLGSIPATMGSTKKGPKRRSYNRLDTIAANVEGFILRPSLSSYMLARNLKRRGKIALSKNKDVFFSPGRWLSR
jgi:hypothetical protein